MTSPDLLPPTSHSSPRPRNAWLERFGIYFFGVAIGLVLVGLFWNARQRALANVQREEQRQNQGEQAGAGAAPGRVPSPADRPGSSPDDGG